MIYDPMLLPFVLFVGIVAGIIAFAIYAVITPLPQTVEMCDDQCERIGMVLVDVNLSPNGNIRQCTCGFEDPE